jgi:hypothetical protein
MALKDYMKKRLLILLLLSLLIFLLILGAVYFILKNNITGNVVNLNSAEMQKIVVTKENFPQVIQSQVIIQELPKNSKILLKLYNFNSGERQWEESYVLTQGNVKLGTIDNPDITIILASKYISYGDICTITKLANSKGDLGYDTSMNTISLMWKYAKLMKYKNCY